MFVSFIERLVLECISHLIVQFLIFSVYLVTRPLLSSNIFVQLSYAAYC